MKTIKSLFITLLLTQTAFAASPVIFNGNNAKVLTSNIVIPSAVGIGQSTPKGALHVGAGTTSGTVDPSAIILGIPNTTNNIGANATIIGNGNIATGTNSLSGGGGCTASNTNATCLGTGNVASGAAALAGGHTHTAQGSFSFAWGDSGVASGTASVALGFGCVASGPNSLSMGNQSASSGNSAVSMGFENSAGGDYSLSGGRLSQSNQLLSYSFGSEVFSNHTGARVVGDSQSFITASDLADQYKARFTGGFKWVKGGGVDNFDGPNYGIIQDTVNTTDATLTTLETIAIPTNTTVLIESRILARRTGGVSGSAGDTGSLVRRATCKNVAGTVTANGVQTVGTDYTDVALAATISASGTNCIVQVTGILTTNYTWDTTTSVQTK